MSKRSRFAWLMMVVLAVLAAAPLFAQGAEAGQAAQKPAAAEGVIIASILAAGFALGIAAGLGGIGQGKAIGSAAEAIARNPSATGDIRGAMILGLVFIESLVIYVLFISLVLVFLRPWG